MGRRRLNKKLRLNIPLHCTALTPLDFLALFYKLFFLLNPRTPHNSISNLLPDRSLLYGDSQDTTLKNDTRLESFELGKSLTLYESISQLNPVPIVSPLNTF